MDVRTGAALHRTRYLRLLNELARRTLDTHRDWLEHVEQELTTPLDDHRTRPEQDEQI